MFHGSFAWGLGSAAAKLIISRALNPSITSFYEPDRRFRVRLVFWLGSGYRRALKIIKRRRDLHPNATLVSIVPLPSLIVSEMVGRPSRAATPSRGWSTPRRQARHPAAEKELPLGGTEMVAKERCRHGRESAHRCNGGSP